MPGTSWGELFLWSNGEVSPLTATVLQSFCQWAMKHFPLRLLVREVISLVCMAEQGCWALSVPWVNQGISWGSAQASPPPWSIRRPGQRLLTCLQDALEGEMKQKQGFQRPLTFSETMWPVLLPSIQRTISISKVSINKIQTAINFPQIEQPEADFSRCLVFAFPMSLECRLVGRMCSSTWSHTP